MTWDFRQLFGISWFKSIWKTLLALVLNGILIALLFALATSAIVLILSGQTM